MTIEDPKNALVTAALQNEADARRYQYLKTAAYGSLHWMDGWLDMDDVDKWDEMIDKAIEEK